MQSEEFIGPLRERFNRIFSRPWILALSRRANRISHKLLTLPVASKSLVMLLVIVTCSVIFYVQKTLLEIEEALPLTLSTQERDIRILVNEMGRLVQDIRFARGSDGFTAFSVVLRQTDQVELYLEDAGRLSV